MKKQLAMPKFLGDIYGDLRDRHLLVPVLGLLAAIAAVPFLLGGNPAPVPAAPVTASVPAGAAELEPAVLVEQIEIRNYRKRLEALQKNPFKQQFEVVPEDASVSVADPGSELADPSISLAGEDSTTTADGGSASDGGSATTPAGSPSVGFGAEPEAPSSPIEEVTQVREVETVISYTVGVEVGRAGELEAREAVDRFMELPSPQAPVVIYAGVSENANRAAFLVSRDVIGTRGEGICIRSRSGECALVTMRVGEQREFLYGPDAERFRLKLLSIDAVERSLSE